MPLEQEKFWIVAAKPARLVEASSSISSFLMLARNSARCSKFDLEPKVSLQAKDALKHSLAFSFWPIFCYDSVMNIENVIIVLGPPGSGKGTQGKLLAPILNYNYLSMGQYLREFSNRETALASMVRETINSGHIIKDTWMPEIFEEAIESMPKADGIILDGFPRDLGQAPVLEKFLADHQAKSLKVLFIDVSKEDLILRINQREKDSSEKRADDDPSIISTRFAEYEKKTFPLHKYFEDKGVLISINGNQPIESTHKEIMEKLGL
jgi:adenylate kinase